MTNIRAPGAAQLLYFAIAYGGSAALQKALGFAVFMWLARSLPVREYATFGLLYALQTGLTALAGAGIVESLIGALKGRGNFDLRGGLYGAANSAFGLLGIPSAVLVVVVYLVLLRDESVGLLVLLSVIVAGMLTSYSTLQANLVRLEENHADSLVLSFFVPVGGFVGGVIGFLVAPTVGAFFGGSALGLALATAVLASLRFGFYGTRHVPGDVTAILSRILPFICIAALSWAGGYGNTYLVKTLFTAADVARFTFAFTLSAVMQLVASSLNQVWAPRFYRLASELPRDALESRNRRFFAFQGAALGAVGAAMLVVLPWGLTLLGGNLLAYRDLTVELLLLFAAYAVSIPWWHAQNYFYANNLGRELMNITIVGSVAGLLAWIAAALLFGVIGIYVGFLLQMLARTVAALFAARRHWAVRLQWEGVAIGLLLMFAGAALAHFVHR